MNFSTGHTLKNHPPTTNMFGTDQTLKAQLPQQNFSTDQKLKTQLHQQNSFSSMCSRPLRMQKEEKRIGIADRNEHN